MTQKTLRGMRTCAKKKHVASGRTRRENVPRHILSYELQWTKIYTHVCLHPVLSGRTGGNHVSII